uniref:AB hydrolase-1 domain-containing protein n=1 Tax=Ascaris lumbricoides TaxID=6252 RepID=A0A9J2Q1J5_ASCLU
MGPGKGRNSRQCLSPSSSTRQNRTRGGKRMSKPKEGIEESSRTGWTDGSEEGRKNNRKDGHLRICATQRTSTAADEYAKAEQRLASASASRMPLLSKSATVVDFANVSTAREIALAPASPRRRQYRFEMAPRSLRSMRDSLRASLESFSTQLTPHEAKCRRHNRHRRRIVERSERMEKEKLEDDEAFLSIIEEYKGYPSTFHTRILALLLHARIEGHSEVKRMKPGFPSRERTRRKRHTLECVCERRRCSCLSMFCSSICRILRFTRQLIYCCCLPPLFSRCVSKAGGAFWPPPREYYFFINSNNSMKGAEAAQRAEIKIRKADGKCLRRRDWRFGFEHPCAEEVTDVECFIVRTKRNNHIAGVFVRRSRPLYTLLFSHPNATDISDHLIGIPNLFDAARYLNCNVCSYDYSGYGISEGTPTEENLYADIGAVYEASCLTCTHIAGVFVRRSRPLYTLLFSHPNATDISDHLIGIPNLFDAARYLNCNVCSYDYSGYGISEGTPTEENLYADIGAVYEASCLTCTYLVRERSIAPPDIILWGYSIGASASVELAAKTNDVAGLVLLSPPVSFLRTLCWCKSCRKTTCCRSSSPCPCDRFASIRKMDKISAPTLILHGMLDSMVSLDHVQALYNRCPAAVEPLWIPDVGHNNMGNSAMLWKRIRKFLNEGAPASTEAENAVAGAKKQKVKITVNIHCLTCFFVRMCSVLCEGISHLLYFAYAKIGNVG